ncbi:hypothetical protein FIBSPDRAFT_1040276 [Athelia psychrophila]|uniref:Uncharacterized protein n=1 Tax=Athelia psychrophila TaxID=1759441 RepID=A0A166QEI0_9AGAM|nr:hypothetical protein FIBSPDRAFT_1040276 [Fibularhizoctonia sp. CBS 109695]
MNYLRHCILLFIVVLFHLILLHPPTEDPNDWNDRSELYDWTFVPSADNLVVAVREMSMMDPNRLVFALFSAPYSTSYDPIPCVLSRCKSPPPRIAVDAFGLVWQVTESDFHALRAMAESTRPFKCVSWSIDVSYTCQAGHTIILPPSGNETAFSRVGVDAYYPGRTTRLKKPVTTVDGTAYTSLPNTITSILRMAFSRAGGQTYGPEINEAGEEVMQQVKNALWR